jgi:hypothetical protein
MAMSIMECGFNPAVYVPPFSLPMAVTLTRGVAVGDYMVADMDVRETFRNHMMNPSEPMYHGLKFDNPGLLGNPELKGLVGAMMQFCQLELGWWCSPYFTCRMTMRAVELAKGDRGNQLSAYV